MFQTTSIGLDVHAKSIHAAVLDTTTGELTSQRLPDVTDAGVIDFGREPLEVDTSMCTIRQQHPS
jgi:predicted NBD/HSP70 family sugar kinase